MIAVKAYAKVNLVLHVKSKREDGYHEVETILQNIDLADTLTFKTAEDLVLHCDSSINPQDNLVFKAATLLRDYAKVSQGADIHLTKRIPLQAGLGGGSADAAATLIALNKFWEANLDKAALLKLGAELGSDVNFFIDGGLAYAGGRGEDIKPLKTNLDLPIVIAKPDFGITAKEAYTLWDKSPFSKETDVEKLAEQLNSGSTGLKQFFNDLEAPVLAEFPQLQKLAQIGYQAGANLVMLSGSGSTIFAIVTEQAQKNVFQAWGQEKAAVYKAKTIDRSIEQIES